MADYYISPTGNDTTGNGTIGNPWETISKAYTASTSGDTIYCKDGTFTWLSQTFNGKSLNVKAVNSGSVIFNGAGADITWVVSGSSYLNIIGVEFTNNINTGGDCFINSQNSNYYATNFTNCVFHDLVSLSGVDVGAVFSASGSSGGYFNFVSCLFYKMTSADNTAGVGWAGFINGRGVVSTFINSTIYLNGSSIHALKYLQVSQSFPTYMTLVNTIIQNDGDAITRLAGGNSGYTITPTYSCQYGNWTTNSCSTGIGNITSNPLFIDPTNLDFRLRPNSPCIGTGTII